MNDSLESAVGGWCRGAGGQRNGLLDVLRRAQSELGGVDGETISLIANELNLPRVEVQGVVSFYSFLSAERQGAVVIRLCNDVIDRLKGFSEIAAAVGETLGIGLDETTPDGKITLTTTPCIGMCDQAPAALVNDVVVTNLTPAKARDMVRALREHMDPARLVGHHGDGHNAHPLVNAMVQNNIRRDGPIVLSPETRGEALRRALAITPAEVIRAVKTSRLRGRGGAGFPTGMKWQFTRAAEGDRAYVICNADEGEPGTFKDRVLLTERPDRVFAGMTIAGYAVGATEGILYLRGEYAYLESYLQHVLEQRRSDALLGDRIRGRDDFSFDIRIQLGAGAYICGEETALISSLEGRRGDPCNRPPFPVERGYMGQPTVVNNVETLCCAVKILEEGCARFAEYGEGQSRGTKVLSVCGDCERPGIYEVPFGVTLRSVLEDVGAKDPYAVQVGGPSGTMVGQSDFDRTISFEDLATGGAIMIFDSSRNVLEIVHAFMEFFEDESCGYCTPCRVGNVILREGIERLLDGRGEAEDLERFRQLGAMMKATSRCGLGQTSPNPVLTSLTAFGSKYEALVEHDEEGFRRSFDLDEAVRDARDIRAHSGPDGGAP